MLYFRQREAPPACGKTPQRGAQNGRISPNALLLIDQDFDR
jgi:hypothetical protein